MWMRNRAQTPARRGAVMVESALVLPMFLIFVFGMIEMSLMGMTSQLVTSAAREGCRVAVLNGDVDAKVQEILNSGGITKYTSTISQNTSPDGLITITLTISVNFSNVSWYTPPQFLGSATITASATLSSEQQ
jgi:Flp pilus assembly protein TadG